MATAALTLPFGAFFSRFRPVPLTLASISLVVPFVFLQGLAVNFITLFAARLLLVVSNLISVPAQTMLLQQWAARRDYANINAVGLSQHSLLLALSVSLSAVLIGAVGSWRVAYFVQGGLMAAQLVAWLAVARERYAPVRDFQVRLRAPQRSPVSAIRAYPQAWLIGVTMFFLAATWTAMVTFLPHAAAGGQGHLADAWRAAARVPLLQPGAVRPLGGLDFAVVCPIASCCSQCPLRLTWRWAWRSQLRPTLSR